MLWLIDSCQNKVTADKYHVTISRVQAMSPSGRVLVCTLSKVIKVYHSCII